MVSVDCSGPTWIGPFEPSPPGPTRCSFWPAAHAAGMETRALGDARGAQWTKLLFNSSTNPLCALTGLTHGQLCDFPATRQVGALIGRAVPWPRRCGSRSTAIPMRWSTSRRGSTRTPPQHAAGCPGAAATEIATLNEGLVAQARAVGVAVAVNQAVVDLIRGLEDGWTR